MYSLQVIKIKTFHNKKFVNNLKRAKKVEKGNIKQKENRNIKEEPNKKMKNKVVAKNPLCQ